MPQWDKSVIDGSSQGGAMALILTGFSKDITACAANDCRRCATTAEYKLSRQSGWYQINRNSQFGKAVDQVAPYYDAANFKFIHGSGADLGGLIGTPARRRAAPMPPTTGSKAPRQIVHTPVDGHAVTKSILR